MAGNLQYIKTKPGSVVINSEVRLALVKMRNKAAGPDKIVIEMLIVLDNFRINKIPAVINKVSDNGEILEDISRCIFHCANKETIYKWMLTRSVVLMSHITKAHVA